MAVSDWSSDAKQNISLGGYKLNGEFGALFAELMAQVAAKFSAVDSAVDAAGGGVEALEASIGTWTDETETTTVKAAIEALRPDPEGTTEPEG